MIDVIKAVVMEKYEVDYRDNLTSMEILESPGYQVSEAFNIFIFKRTPLFKCMTSKWDLGGRSQAPSYGEVRVAMSW